MNSLELLENKSSSSSNSTRKSNSGVFNGYEVEVSETLVKSILAYVTEKKKWRIDWDLVSSSMDEQILDPPQCKDLWRAITYGDDNTLGDSEDSDLDSTVDFSTKRKHSSSSELISRSDKKRRGLEIEDKVGVYARWSHEEDIAFLKVLIKCNGGNNRWKEVEKELVNKDLHQVKRRWRLLRTKFLQPGSQYVKKNKEQVAELEATFVELKQAWPKAFGKSR